MMLRAILLCALATTGLAFSPMRPATPLAMSSPTALNMASSAEEVKVGDKLSSVVLSEGQADYGKPDSIDLAELIAGKKVAIFAVPGAFTPGCSKSHLPSFITAQEELKQKGVEMTICLATNDAYVMEVRDNYVYSFVSSLYSVYQSFNLPTLRT